MICLLRIAAACLFLVSGSSLVLGVSPADNIVRLEISPADDQQTIAIRTTDARQQIIVTAALSNGS